MPTFAKMKSLAFWLARMTPRPEPSGKLLGGLHAVKGAAWMEWEGSGRGVDSLHALGGVALAQQLPHVSQLAVLPTVGLLGHTCPGECSVLRAHPVREVVTEDNAINVEMDPEDEWTVRQQIEEAGMR